MLKWAWSFIDRPERTFEDSARFWTAVTDTTLSVRRGAHAEFDTLSPPAEDGDAVIKLQGVGSGGGAHIDLEFDDFDKALTRAVDLGARLVDRDGQWAHVTSPSGYGLCVTGWHGAARTPAPPSPPTAPAPAWTRSASTSRRRHTTPRSPSGAPSPA